MDKDEYFDFVYGSMLEQARMFLKAADADGSGKLSKDELAAVFSQVYMKIREGRLRRRFVRKLIQKRLQITVIVPWRAATEHGKSFVYLWS